MVHLVDNEGKLSRPLPVAGVLESLDRRQNFLVQVAAPTSDGPMLWPVCRIMEKAKVREAEKARLKPAKRPQNVVKQLELNWAIDRNDLAHRMDRMEDFLTKGMRVELVLAGKRKGRKATLDEADAMLATIRQRVQACEGVKEVKPMEGKLLGLATLFFQGPQRK